jgi:hypothetical protein
MRSGSLSVILLLGLVCHACGVAAPPRPDRSVGLFDQLQMPGDPSTSPQAAAAEEGPKFETFSLRVGGQAISQFATTFRLDSERLGRGTEVRLENDLGFDESTEFGRVDAVWRFNRDHAVELTYFGFSRRASRQLNREIQWGDQVFAIDTEIYALFQSDVLKAAYRYTFAGGADWELGASIGVHGTRIRTAVGIQGTRFESGQELQAVLPLPVVGLRGTWELGDDFRLTGSADLFYIALSGIDPYDEFEGFLVDALVAAEYDLFENFAVGIGGNYFRIDASISNDPLTLGAEYEYIGALLFGRLNF